MKKVIVSILAGLFVVILSVVIAFHNLPPIASLVISKITGQNIRISHIGYSYEQGVLSVLLTDIRLSGDVKGTIESWNTAIETKKGLYLKDIIVSNFTLDMVGVKKKTPSFPIPQRLLLIQNGTITYSGISFFIDEIVAHSVPTKKSFILTGTITRSNLMQKLTFSGEGTYKKRVPTVNGQFSISALNLSQISPMIEGQATVSGSFSYGKKGLSLDGPFDVSGCIIRNSVFRKPLHIGYTQGKLSLNYSGNLIRLHMSDIAYRDTHFVTNLTLDHTGLHELELSSGFFNIRPIVDDFPLHGVDPALLKSLTEGMVRIRKLVHNNKTPLHAEMELQNVGITIDKKYFTNLKGFLTVDDQNIHLSEIQATYGGSRVYNVSGIIPFGKDKITKLKGNFSFDLRDIPSLIDIGNLTFTGGATAGTIEVEGKPGKGYKISGAGTLTNGNIQWKKLTMSAQGSYTFTDNTVVFNPLILQKGNTMVSIKGKWGENLMDLTVKGSFDPALMKHFIATPFNSEGVMRLDVAFLKKQNDPSIRMKGTMTMDSLLFELPGLMKKPPTVASGVQFALRMKDNIIFIENFNFTLDTLRVSLTGTVNDYKKIDCNITATADNFSTIQPIFLLDRDNAEGHMDIRLQIRNLVFPLRTLPLLYGTIHITNGFLRLPWLVKPVKHFTLTSSFHGSTGDIVIENMVCGNSILTKGTFSLKDIERRLVSLVLTMENFRSDDFFPQLPLKTFTIPIIHEGSFISTINSDISINMKQFTIGAIQGDTLSMRGAFRNKKMSISELRANIFNGNFNFNGSIDFSAPAATLTGGGKLNRIQGGLLLSAFGDTSGIFESRISLFGNVGSQGNDIQTLRSNLHGTLTFYSRNGVIKRWNLLSKVFGILNVTYLIKGKINFGHEGLSYTRMGANFTAQHGVFHTDDFVIDSPSMLLHGTGNVDISTNRIDGSITVSPLVALDKFIDTIPIIRNILREKRRGFLYAVFSVNGPIDDPSITTNVMETVGGRTLEVLKNIFRLPAGVSEE